MLRLKLALTMVTARVTEEADWTCNCLAVVPAIGHHISYVMFVMHGQQKCDMNVNEAVFPIYGIIFTMKCVTLPKKLHTLHTLKSIPAMSSE